MTAAQKQQRYRARLAAGRRVFNIECDEVGVEELLIASGMLKPSDRDDPDARTAALEKLIATPIAESDSRYA